MNRFAATSFVLAAIATVFCGDPRAEAQGARLLNGDAWTSGNVSGACDDCGAGACDSLVCGCAAACGVPRWSATADALFLERSDPDASVLAFNTADPAQDLNADDFHFGVHTGFDLALTRHFNADQAVEFRYFGVDHWDAGVTAATTPGDLFQVNAAVPVFTFTGDAITADYVSELHNAEINGRQRLSDWLHLLVGFRYVELDERGSASLTGAAVPFDYYVSTRNRLYGFQLGGMADLLSNRGPFSVTAVGKAGLFGNAAAQDSSYTTGLVTLPSSVRSDRTAFVGEIGVIGTYRLTDALALRTGYRTLWISSVALASEQLARSDFANGSGFDGDGDVFYHGAFAGIELRR